MHWRDVIRIGVNHHLLNYAVASDPWQHCETLESLFADDRFDVLDLWIPEEPAIAAREIAGCRASGKTIIYNIGTRSGKPSPHPASLDPETRAYSLAFYKQELDRAIEAGAVKVVTNSGADVPGNRAAAVDALVSFYLDICRYVPEDVTVLIEPTDREISKRKLIGPSREAAALCERIHAAGCANFASMVDMGHVPLLGETIEQAFRASGRFVGHVHLGNCILRDQSHPLFGDKHVPWGLPGGEYDISDIAEAIGQAMAIGYLAPGNPGTVSFEMRPYPDCSPQESVDVFFAKLEDAWTQVEDSLGAAPSVSNLTE